MIKTLLADHGELSLIGLRAVLENVPRVDIVGVANDAISMQAMLVRHRPDVVLIDHTSDGFGAQTIRDGIRRSKRTRFISITPEPSPFSITSAIKAGVTSFIRKDCAVNEIIDAVLNTADGSKFFCGKVLETLRRASVDVDRFLEEPLTCAPVMLSERECQVVALIAEGSSYTKIAEQLNLSAHTVTTHRRNIMQKLGVNNTTAVVMYAMKNGLISPNKFLRAQLTISDNTLIGPDLYNQLFTMHGSTMMYLFAVPLLEGLALYLLPLLLGSRDVAFPRLTAFSYWTYLFGGILFYTSFLADVVPDAGWFAYTPLSGPRFSGMGVDFWLLGLSLVEVAGITAGIEIVVTILKFRAPGMSLNRMPIFIWAMLVSGVMIIFAFTTLLTATVMLELDRAAGTAFFDPGRGGNSLLWQHLFWFFGHPEVYIMFIPATGIISMVVTVIARRALVGYALVVTALVVIGFVSFGLWVHHMFTTGLPELALAFFTAASLMIGIASGIQIFAWIATLWGSRPKLNSAALYVFGFFFIFVLGGVTGIMVAVVTFDWQVHDTFFIVAHFHYVLIGGVVFPLLAGLHHWYPKLTGRMLDERMGVWGFWGIFIGFNVTFFPMHIMGLLGMPRRIYTYPAELGLDGLNILSTAGAVVMTIGFGLFLWNTYKSARRGAIASADPWNGDSLEWSVNSPPPSYAFLRSPIVRGRHPLWVKDEDASRDTWIEGIRDAMTCAPMEFRATLVTDAMHAKPEAIQPLPGPSYTPLVVAVGVLIGFVGVLVKLYLVSIAGVIVTIYGTFLWLWPDREREELIRNSGVAKAAGLTMFPTGIRSTDHWATISFLAVIATSFGALTYSYFYLQLFSESWPQDDLPRPVILSALIATGLALGGAGVTWFARKMWMEKQSSPMVLLSGASLAGLGVGIMHIISLSGLQFTPSTNGYGSVFWVISGLLILVLVIVLTFTGSIMLLGKRRWNERDLLQLPVDIMTLLWYGLAGGALLTFVVLYLSPYIIG